MNAGNLAPQVCFPGNYLLKIIGLNTDEFFSVVKQILHKHMPNFTEDAITYNKSSGNKYISMSVNFYVENKQQIDELYRALTANPMVLMAL